MNNRVSRDGFEDYIPEPGVIVIEREGNKIYGRKSIKLNDNGDIKLFTEVYTLHKDERPEDAEIKIREKLEAAT